MSNSEVLEQITHGYRMPRHENCPEKMYEYMLRCWDATADNRPTFEVNPRLSPFCTHRSSFSSIYTSFSMIIQPPLVHNITAKTNQTNVSSARFYEFRMMIREYPNECFCRYMKSIRID